MIRGFEESLPELPMMLYTLIESFSPADGDKWTSYCAWRGIAFERFDSIDGINRPLLFYPEAGEDWAHVVAETDLFRFMTDLDFALRKQREAGRGDVVGVKLADHDETDPGFLGYDLIDGYCDVSLLTNFGCEEDKVGALLSPSALVMSLEVIQSIQAELLRTTPADDHVEGCRIVSIYNLEGRIAGRGHAPEAVRKEP